VRVVRQGASHPLPEPVLLHLEDGAERAADGALPPDLPLGYHELRPLRGGRVGDDVTTLIVSPGVCAAPPGRAWGWAAQLYAARSTASWGVGDLADLYVLGSWSRGLGAGAVLLNPLNAAVAGPRDDPSPYRPSSRQFLDPLYLRIEDLPGALALRDDLERLSRAGRALNASRTIDRDAVLRLKLDALERLWELGAGAEDDDGFAAFRMTQGDALRAWAVHAVLAEQYGSDWRTWPADLRHPANPAVAAAGAAAGDRVRFHSWVQWLLDEQLRRAGAAAPLVMDLPVGVAPHGFDAWRWQDQLAVDASFGAPPDLLGPAGQDWEMPPFIPWKLRQAAYRPFVETLRATLRHAAGLRLDHVLGLFRLFWVPPAGSPTDGTYVRYPTRELLDVLALESHRAGAFIAGEDLGTVAEGVRAQLLDRRMLRYQVLLFEEGPPDAWSELALASVTTHDLPTVAGVMTGSDARMQREIGLEPDAEWAQRVRRRLARQAGIDLDASSAEASVAIHRVLASSRSVLAVAQLEDALAVEERPNVPGTTPDVRANWSLALPRPLDDLMEDPLVAAVADALREGR